MFCCLLLSFNKKNSRGNFNRTSSFRIKHGGGINPIVSLPNFACWIFLDNWWNPFYRHFMNRKTKILLLFYGNSFELQNNVFTSSLRTVAAINYPWSFVIVQDPKATRSTLLSDGQNMYNRVILVCTVNVYIPASLGRRPILMYQVSKCWGPWDLYLWLFKQILLLKEKVLGYVVSLSWNRLS